MSIVPTPSNGQPSSAPSRQPSPVEIELETLIRARYPIIYLVSWEERRVEETLREICQRRGKKMILWTVTTGLGGNAAARDPLAALDQVMGAPDQSVFVLKDFHPFITDVGVTRRLRDLVYALKTSYKTLIILSPILKLPPELEKEITVVDYQLPTVNDIDRLLEGIVQSVRSNPKIRVDMTPLEREQILKAASGLTSNEAENVFAKSLVEKGRFDVDVILGEKEQIIRKSGILEYYRVSEAFADVGGVDLLKQWMEQRTASFNEAARRYGLPEPRGVLLLGVQGCGKCFARDTPILMFDGTVKAVQDVCAGDRVMGPDSLPRLVLSTTRGRDEMYRVTPTKGRPYTVNADHILTLRMSGTKRRYFRETGADGIVNLTVREYLGKSASFKQRAMGYRAGVDFPSSPVPLDPYFLGVWLGDGSEKEVAVKSNPDNKAATYHVTGGMRGGVENPLTAALRQLGVWGDKHIPHLYKANDREVRLRLLAGIIDTDGHFAGGDYEVIQKRERLANDIAYVARSLGLAAYVTPCSKSCTVNGQRFAGRYYRVHLSGNVDMIPVRLHQKQAGARRQCKDVLHTGITVTPVGVGDYYGFAVDGDHRFLLDDFTVVHNSLIAKSIASLWKLPLLRLDVGKVFAGIVGSSEENMRKAIATAESVAPCVAGDTRITLADGSERTIQELYEGDETELTVLGMDERFQPVPVRVKAVTRRAAPDLFTVRLMHSTLQATSNHLHPVLRDGELNWVRTDALQPGDHIAVPRYISPAAAAPAMLGFLPADTRLYAPGALEYARPECRTPQRRYAARVRGADFVRVAELEDPSRYPAFDAVTEFARGRGGTARSVLPRLPAQVNEDVAYLLGLMDSDGFVGSRSRVGFVNTDLELHRVFADLLHRQFGLLTTTRLGAARPGTALPGTSEASAFRDCWVTCADNRLLVKALAAIRERLLTLPADLLRAYVRGYFDGDGFVSDSSKGAVPKVVITSKVPPQDHLVRSALLRIGFPATNPGAANIEITGWHNVQRFIRQVGSGHPMRRQRMRAWAEMLEPDEVKDRTDVIPIGARLRRARQEIGMGSQHFRSASSALLHRWEHGIGHPNRDRLQAVVAEMRAWAEERHLATTEVDALANLVDAPTGWSPTVAVEVADKPDFVYDLVCDAPHTFLANDVYTHNCILWLDELEKGFAGTQSSGFSDGGTTSRVFGSFITWLQEKQAPCFVVATSNDVSQLPPELMRKGRFDEIFFVDLPAAPERREIFEIHLRKRRRDPANFDLDKLAQTAVGYSGAEIEQVVVSALFRAFNDDAREVTTDDMLAVLEESVPLSVTMREGIQRLRDWADTRARAASSAVTEDADTLGSLDTARRFDASQEPRRRSQDGGAGRLPASGRPAVSGDDFAARLAALERRTATGMEPLMEEAQNVDKPPVPPMPTVQPQGTSVPLPGGAAGAVSPPEESDDTLGDAEEGD